MRRARVGLGTPGLPVGPVALCVVHYKRWASDINSVGQGGRCRAAAAERRGAQACVCAEAGWMRQRSARRCRALCVCREPGGTTCGRTAVDEMGLCMGFFCLGSFVYVRLLNTWKPAALSRKNGIAASKPGRSTACLSAQHRMTCCRMRAADWTARAPSGPCPCVWVLVSGPLGTGRPGPPPHTL